MKNNLNIEKVRIDDLMELLSFVKEQGFDFEISKKRRQQEQDNGDEDLFFPRVILNQDSNTKSDTPMTRTPTPNEVPKKKKSEKAEVEDEEGGEYLEAPYTKENYPSQLKNLPVGARNLWIRTFNAVYEETKDENQARQAAWRQVKNKYKKVGDKWVKKDASEELENE